MHIVWRKNALEDLRNARAYLEKQDTGVATRVVGAIVHAVAMLATTPYIGRPGRVDETRELVIPGTPYLVAYAVIADDLVILDVLHYAQEWPGGFG